MSDCHIDSDENPNLKGLYSPKVNLSPESSLVTSDEDAKSRNRSSMGGSPSARRRNDTRRSSGGSTKRSSQSSIGSVGVRNTRTFSMGKPANSTNLWVLFLGDADVGINSMLQFFTRQKTIRELQRQRHPLSFLQTKRLTINTQNKNVNLICTSQAFMDAMCEDRLSRQMLYHEAYSCSLAIVMFDITKKATFLNAIGTYVPELRKNNPDMSIVMMALGAEARETSMTCVSHQEASYFVECSNLHGYFEAHSINSGRPYYLVDTMIEKCIGYSMKMMNSSEQRPTNDLPEPEGKLTRSTSTTKTNKVSTKAIVDAKKTVRKQSKKAFGSLRKRLDTKNSNNSNTTTNLRFEEPASSKEKEKDKDK